MFGSAQFAGWMLASIFVPRFGDLYGRKKPFYASLIVASLAYIAVLFVTNVYVMISLFFVFGLT